MAALVMVQHPVEDFEAWKKMFDSDPIGRREHGVERYSVYRSPDADYTMVGLEFATLAEAQAFDALLEQNLRPVWDGMGVEGRPTRVLELVETETL